MTPLALALNRYVKTHSARQVCAHLVLHVHAFEPGRSSSPVFVCGVQRMILSLRQQLAWMDLLLLSARAWSPSRASFTLFLGRETPYQTRRQKTSGSLIFTSLEDLESVLEWKKGSRESALAVPS